MSDEAKDSESDTARRVEFLSEYRYFRTDAIDNVLIEYVQTEVLNSNKLLHEYRKLMSEVDSAKLAEEFMNVWKQY